MVNPLVVVDIGGATTDIHSRDLVRDNIVSESGYDRLVLKLGVYKSRETLIFAASNEFVYELLAYLNVTENILEEENEKDYVFDAINLFSTLQGFQDFILYMLRYT